MPLSFDSSKQFFRRWRWQLLAWVVVTAALGVLSHWSIHPLTAKETVVLAIDLLVIAVPIEIMRRVLAPGRWEMWVEYLRLGTLIYIAIAVFAPFLTSELLGGQDATWYAYVLVDALKQSREGIFPVWIGQSEFMFNGAIHPFLTAPFYTNFGILLDRMTCHALSPLEVQHLSVIVIAGISALVSYCCLALLLPKLRWIAWGLAALYVTAPIFTLYIYASEMYMTFAAFAWLPLVLYGNIRLIQTGAWRNWVCLVIGLALVWRCHAGVAAWSTFFTAGVQGLRLVTRDYNWPSWRRALLATLLFGGLTLGYFVSVQSVLLNRSMSEWRFRLYALAVGIGVVSLLRWLVAGNSRWLIGVAIAIGGLASVRLPSAVLFALVFLGCAGLRGLARWRPSVGWRRRLPECVIAILLVSGLVTNLFLPEADETWRYIHHRAAEFTLQQIYPTVFLPISADATLLGDLQPGYSLLALLLIAGVALIFCARTELSVLFLAGSLLACMIAPVPALTPLLYALAPDPLYGFAPCLWLRFFPLLANVMLFAGAIALSFLSEGRWPWARKGLITLIGASALVWNYLELGKPMQRGERAINSVAQTESFYRTENAPLLYAYDQLTKPAYAVHGVVDYHLENRLLSVQDKSVQPDPILSAPAESVETITTEQHPANPAFFWLKPEVRIKPGERLMMRFEFFDRPYNGYLDIRADEMRRIYYLPNAGREKAFGVSDDRPKVLSIWNSNTKDLVLKWAYMSDTPPEAGKPFGDFARVHFRRFRPEDLQIKIQSLLPYRANVALTTPAYLETSRAFIPGYRAKVNGRETAVEVSPEHLAMIRLEAGANEVELVYRGTRLMWVAVVTSALAWAATLGVILRSLGRNQPAEASIA